MFRKCTKKANKQYAEVCYTYTIQTIRFIKVQIFYDAQLFIVNNKNLFVMRYSNILKHKIFV